MKKGLLVSISALMALSLGACSNTNEQQPEEPKTGYTAGTYTASARGMKGDVTVEVTFTDAEITKVDIKDQHETFV